MNIPGHSSRKLEGKIALVTGASRGIGAAVAKRFAREGGHVILVARTGGALEQVDDAIKAEGGTATLVLMDLCEYDKIDALGAEIANRYGRLDILVGNAGMLGGLSPVGHYAPEIWDKVIGLNLTANWRLLRIMDPLLRAAPFGRAVFVTSGVTKGVFPYYGPYAASKAALEVLIETYAAEVSHTKVRANLVDPGIVRTRMREEAMPGEDPMKYPLPEDITDVFVALAEETCRDSGKIWDAQ